MIINLKKTSRHYKILCKIDGYFLFHFVYVGPEHSEAFSFFLTCLFTDQHKTDCLLLLIFPPPTRQFREIVAVPAFETISRISQKCESNGSSPKVYAELVTHRLGSTPIAKFLFFGVFNWKFSMIIIYIYACKCYSRFNQTEDTLHIFTHKYEDARTDVSLRITHQTTCYHLNYYNHPDNHSIS